MLAFRQLACPAVQRHAVELYGRLFASGKDERCIVQPGVLIDVGVHRAAEEALLTCLQTQRHQPVLVALIAVAFHGLPSNPLAIRRIRGIRVVALVVGREVLMRTRTYIKKVYVAVG